MWAGALGRPRGMGWGGRQETRSERDMCTPMFIAALFIVARTWKQPRWPSADEWIRICCTYRPWNITQPLKSGFSCRRAWALGMQAP